MPFTPSHAVIALPFRRTPLVPPAIAVGAMTPDLPLFLRGYGPSYGFTHATTNLVWTTLIAAVLLLVWRMVLRPASVELMPAAIAARLPAQWRSTGPEALRETFAPRERFGSPLLLVLSLMLGVLSHIVWDAFTHEERWGVELLPVLAERWGPLLGYKWLQYGTAVLGLAVLAVAGWIWLRGRTADAAVQRVPAVVRIVWWLSLPAVLLAASLIGLMRYGPFTEDFTPAHLGYRVLLGACGLWGLATLVLCVVVVLVGRPRHQTG